MTLGTEEISSQTFKEDKSKGALGLLLKDKQFLAIPKVGDVVKGRVFRISRTELMLDIPGFRPGIVRGAELTPESNHLKNYVIGNEVEATVLALDNELGMMELSLREAGYRRKWDTLEELRASGGSAEVTVRDANRGGLIVMLAQSEAFLPVSQLSPEHYPRVPNADKTRIFEKLKEFVGMKLQVQVLDADEKEEKIIVSERAVWEADRAKLLKGFTVGEVVEGTVAALTDFGAFIRVQPKEAPAETPIEAFVHISELSWKRLEHPREVLAIGQEVHAQIVQIDGAKMYLSLKRLEEDPWKQAADIFHVGDVVKGMIVKINPYGLIVSLSPTIHGLAHISKLGIAGENDVSARFAIGGEYEFEIVEVNPAAHRIALALPGVKQGEEQGETSSA